VQPLQITGHFQIQESIAWKAEFSDKISPLCLNIPEEGKLTVVCNIFFILYYSGSPPPHLGFCIQPDDGYI